MNEGGGRPPDWEAPYPDHPGGSAGDDLTLQNLEARLQRLGESANHGQGSRSALSMAEARLRAEATMTGRSSARRYHVARYAAPVAFLALVVGLVAVIIQSGILGESASVAPVPTSSVSASPSASPTMYKVKKGDTLSHIAATHHTTVDAIVGLNPGLTANNLTVGQHIKIPVVVE